MPFTNITGFIPRFLHGEQISYAVGDASNAYSGSDLGENTDDWKFGGKASDAIWAVTFRTKL